MIGSTPYVLVTYPGLGVRNLGELMTLARAKPGALNYGSAGPASMAHLAAALLGVEAGIDIVHVPYRSSVHAVTDIMAGRVQMQFATIPPSAELIATGKLTAVAVSGSKRSTTLPDVATAKEQGFPDFLGGITFGAYAQMKTPRPVLQSLNTTLNKVMLSAEMKQWFDKVGAKPVTMSLDEARAWYLKELAAWKDVVTKAGIALTD